MASTATQPNLHLNLRVRGLGRSATLAINEHSAALEREGRQVLRFGLGQSPFPVPEPVQDSLRENAFRKDYLDVQGLADLRRSVAGFYARRGDVDVEPDDVLIGPGSKELMFLTQLVYYGDLVIPTPSWVSYAPQAHILGRHVCWVPTRPESGWRLQADELERLCREDPSRPRLLILNYPNNPTGGTYPDDELAALAEVARRYGVVLLSDEIYGEVRFDGDHHSIARYYPEGTIVSSGLSKWCGAGGWRLGVYLFPPALRPLLDGMAAVASETFTSTSAPIQFAAVRAFDGGPEIDHYLDDSRRILGSIARWSTGRLREADLHVVEPEGGFYLFPGLEAHRGRLAERGIHDAPTLCRRLLDDTGVAVLPGSDFGRPADELTLRLALVDFDGGAALAAAKGHPPQGSDLDEAFLRQHCPKVVAGIEALCDWLGGSP